MASKAGIPFSTMDGAGITAVQEVNRQSITSNREFGGWIQDVGIGYTFTTAASSPSGDEIKDLGPKPKDVVGIYHTHAGHFDQTDEYFSPDDKTKATLGKWVLTWVAASASLSIHAHRSAAPG